MVFRRYRFFGSILVSIVSFFLFAIVKPLDITGAANESDFESLLSGVSGVSTLLDILSDTLILLSYSYYSFGKRFSYIIIIFINKNTSILYIFK